MSSDAEHPLARRDEVLQLLYWIEGEGFGNAATLERLARFLTYPEEEIRGLLETLIRAGDVRFEPSDREYRLTGPGKREAARRFADEFSPLLHQGHGECNDPECECHDDPAAAAECHARARPPSS
jgi:hypothetical protein